MDMGHTDLPKSPLAQPVYTISEKPKVGGKGRSRAEDRNYNNIEENLSHLPHGTEGAKVATNNAIISVSWAMQQAQEESQTQATQINSLQKEKKRLETLIASTEASLKATKHELTTTQMSLKEFADRNEELFTRLASEQAAFQRLKEESLNIEGMYKDLIAQNQELMARQSNEKQIREELASELSIMHQEINGLELEKSQFQHHYSELELKLKIETDQFEAKREQWKEKQMKFLQKIQTEEARFHESQRENEELQHLVKEKDEHNGYLELQVRSREKQLKELTKEYHEAKEELKRVLDLNTAAQQKNTDLKNQVTAVNVQLKEAKEQVRILSEKVFQLMQQLKEMDTWKTKATSKHLETERNALDLKRRAKSLENNYESEKKKTDQLKKKEKDLQRTIEKSQKELAKTKSKLTQSQNKVKRLELGLKGQKSLVKERKKVEYKLSSQLSTAKNSKRNQMQTIAKLEHDIKKIHSQEKSLQVELKQTRKAKEQLENGIKSRDRQLEWWRKKNQLFDQLKTAVASEHQTAEALAELESFESTLKTELEAQGDNIQDSIDRASSKPKSSKRGGLSSTSKGKTKKSLNKTSFSSTQPRLYAIRSKSRNAYAESRQHRMTLRKLLRGKSGKELSQVLEDLKIPESDVLEWSSSPRSFFTGVSTLVSRVLKEDFGSKPSSVKDKEIRMMGKKAMELEERIEELEEAKTKAVMRLSLLVAHQGMKSNIGSGNSDMTFLTQHDSDNSKIKGIDFSESENPALLQLSDNRIDDTEVGFLAKSLKINDVITEVDLKHNEISDAGLMSLLVTCITDSCRVGMIDLRRNRISMRGLEVMVSFVVQNMELDIISSASFAEERGKSLVPYIRITTPTNTVNIDLRGNPLFPSNYSSSQRKHFLQRLASTLALKNADHSSENNMFSVPPDREKAREPSDFKVTKEEIVKELNKNMQSTSLYSSPFSERPSDDTILRQASHSAIGSWNTGPNKVPRSLQLYQQEMGSSSSQNSSFPGVVGSNKLGHSSSSSASMFYTQLRRTTQSIPKKSNSTRNRRKMTTQASSPLLRTTNSAKSPLGKKAGSPSRKTTSADSPHARSGWKSNSGTYEKFPRLEKRLSLTNTSSSTNRPRKSAW